MNPNNQGEDTHPYPSSQRPHLKVESKVESIVETRRNNEAASPPQQPHSKVVSSWRRDTGPVRILIEHRQGRIHTANSELRK
jgi:hypothetical protein